MRQKLLSILALLLLLMQGGNLTAFAASFGSNGGFNWTMDDDGNMTVTGSGELPGYFIDNNGDIKSVVFDENCQISTLKNYCIYWDNNITSIVVNSIVPLSVEGSAFWWSSDSGSSPISITINAPKVTIAGSEPFFSYRRQLNITVNTDELIVYNATMSYLGYWNSNNSFAYPANSSVYTPAGYVFTDSDMQENYNSYVDRGREEDFWQDHGSMLTEGVDYTYNAEASSVPLTSANASTVFGGAQTSSSSRYIVNINESTGITTATAALLQGKAATFSRTFTSGVSSTICMPFPMTSITGGTAYEFTAMEKVEDVWTATMSAVSSTVAGKPYLFKASADGAVSFSGTIPNEFTGVAASSAPVAYSGGGTWTFCGTYTTLTYGTNLSGAVYGFAAQSYSANSINPGDFVKAETGAYVSPFRCYLTYIPPSAARSMTRGADIELPSRIVVRLVGSNGETTAIGTMDTRTGEVVLGDEWFGLDGRRIQGQPTQKGVYINNGKKVVIK